MIHAVPGWGQDHGGRDSVGRLRPYIEAQDLVYRVHEHRWPRLHTLALLQQRRRTRDEAADLAPLLRDGDGLITYSNGSPVGRHALLQTDAVLDTWVMVAPALPCNVEVPSNVRQVIVLYSLKDNILPLAWMWTWANPVAWVLGHDWGMLGRYGYSGDDLRVRNWTRDNAPKHTGWFEGEPLQFWGPKIARMAKGV